MELSNPHAYLTPGKPSAVGGAQSGDGRAGGVWPVTAAGLPQRPAHLLGDDNYEHCMIVVPPEALWAGKVISSCVALTRRRLAH